MDANIEEFVNSCPVCQVCLPKKKQCPLSSWKKPSYAFERIHLDHFQFKTLSYLVIVDQYSGWIHVAFQKKTDSENVIASLKQFFANFGLPDTIVTDNGTPFVSLLFEKFCKANNIRHTTSPPYHPESNGLAERAVGTTKSNLRKYLLDHSKKSVSMESQIQNFLFMTHNTPLHDGLTPSEKIFKYKVKTNFSSLQISRDTSKESSTSQSSSQTPISPSQKHRSATREFQNAGGRNHEKVETKPRQVSEFAPNDDVYVVYGPEQKFVEGQVQTKLSTYVYMVRLASGKVVKVHRDSIRRRHPIRHHHLQVNPSQTTRRRHHSPSPTGPFVAQRLRKQQRIDYQQFY